MNIKNYTSTTPAAVSMARIEEKLVQVGATNISKSYREDKACSGITFVIYDERIGQSIPYHIKAKVQECFDILWQDVKRPRADTKTKTLDQANRTAWKIVSDWIEIQCTMIILGQAEPMQMFLPFAFDLKKNETFYEKVIYGKVPLQLGS